MKAISLACRFFAAAIIGASFLVDTLFPSPQQAPLGSVKGVLVNELTGEPIRRGVLLLQQIDQQSILAASADVPQEKKVQSGSDGGFVFDQLSPGLYKLRAEHPAFLTRTFRSGGSPFVVVMAEEPTENTDSLRFALTPRGTITGRVTDQEGYAMTGAQVVVLRYRWSMGKRVVQGSRAPQAVDDRGEFRVGNLEPGRYTLYANLTGKTVRTDDGMSYVKTYYPNAHQLSEAGSIFVRPGSESNVTVQLQRKRTFHVDGQIVNATTGEAVVDNPMFVLLETQQESDADSGSPAIPQFSRYGSFEFRDVLPGSYVIQPGATPFLSADTGEKVIAKYAGRHEIVVSDQDLKDISVLFRLGTTIVGSVVLEKNHEKSVSDLSAGVHLVTLEHGGSNFRARTDHTGAFEMTYVWPGRYRVFATDLPDGHYVASAEFGRQEVSDEGFLVPEGGGFIDLQLSIAAGAASVNGSVRWEGSEIVAGTEFTVTLAPTAVHLAGEPLLFRHVVTSAQGDFSFANLAPGDYSLLAWEQVDLDAAMSPEFRKYFLSLAATVSLREGGQEAVRLRPVASDSLSAIEAQMQ